MESKWATRRNKKLKHLQETLIEHTPVNTTETSASKSKGNSKNENSASVLNRDQQENINLFTVINLQSLTNYGEQLKTQLDFNLTQ